MKRNILKSVLAGLALGAAAYFAPFFLFPFFILILLGGILRFAFFRRHRYGWNHRNYDPVFVDAIRGMSEEEYTKFRERNYCAPERQQSEER